jgi:hypothetical protein
MSAPRTRADELLEAWTKATDRPVPAFIGGRRRHRSTRTALILIVIALVAALLGALAVGGYIRRSDQDPPDKLVAAVVQAIATAPGIHFSLTIGKDADHPGIDSSGVIDFEHRRFSGTADGGTDGSPMLFFGGPSSGGVIVADGLFVQTEGAPWVHMPGTDPHLDWVMDRPELSNALKGMFDASVIDPAIRFAPCGAEMCRVIAFMTPAKALSDAEVLLLGTGVQLPPSDLEPTNIVLLIDPPSGFPVRMDTTIKAGPTTTIVSLELSRLEPVPSISPPVP